ncbi:ATR-interacting protein isoform X2 [Osmerus mordax]
MEYPPSKRHKGFKQDAAFHDPFEDDEDFTQDDLNEIDIIASQAFTGDGTHQRHKQTLSSGNGQLSEADKNCKLESQKAELKKKLKEVEEEILMKNGEIRVLRDSLRVAQQEKEKQRQAQLLLEREKAHVQSEKEKELSKKVQSLQSELHFKEAEMNEIKTKLQISERGNKALASPVTRNSPKVHCSAVTIDLASRSSSTPPGGSPFITKEDFAAQLPSRSTPVKSSGTSSLKDEGKKLSFGKHGDSKEASQLDPFDSTGVHHHHPGSVLLSLLLQHPLDPSTLGLCHLLCVSPDAWPTLLQNSCLSTGSTTVSSSGYSKQSKVAPRDKPQSAFSQFQSLAMSGLNMMASPEQVSHTNSSSINSSRSCLGAVYLLPLLDYHISLFCQALESLEGSCKSPLRVSSASGSSSEGSAASSVEDSLLSLEDFALSSMKALYHVVSQSADAVSAILSCQPQESNGGEAFLHAYARSHPTPVPSEIQLMETGEPEGSPDRAGKGLHIQHPLLRRLLGLSDPAFIGKASQREALVTTSLSTLCMLAERAEKKDLSRLMCVLSSQALTHCLSLDSSYQIMSLSMSLLAALVDNDELATKLCSHSDSCLFLKIFQYITSRPDKLVTNGHWSLMEVEMVRFLTSLFTQNVSLWVTFVESTCQCHSEVVQTVVVLLHRQWLGVRGQEMAQAPAWWSAPGVQLLRETLMLLHWLLLNHSSFSEQCRPVLHMYDQVIPAIRDTLRKIPDLTESEELALEEICRPETEDTEDMD